MEVWRNWAGNQRACPARVVTPAHTRGVAAAVTDAVRDGLTVKAGGSGHSFTGVAVTDGCLLRMDRLDRLVRADAGTGEVTVQAGMPLHRLNPLLGELGLAMTNLGDIDSQTVSGAISTGTHGTGRSYGGLATQVRGLELVLVDGSIVRCSTKERPDLFAAARLGLGALGVITSVTLACEPAFMLRAVEAPMPFDRVLASLDTLVAETDHVDIHWFPHTNVALTKRNTRLPGDTPRRPVPAFRGWLDDELLSNTAFGLVNRLCAAAPRLTPAVNNVSARALSAREYVDTSYRVFTSPRRVPFVEMEYAVPRDAITEVLLDIRRWIDGSGERIPFPLEVRFAAADDVWLSTAYDRDTAYVAVHQYPRLPHERYFAAVEDIVAAVDGRPHWGKLHGLTADRLGELYPRFADFTALRDKVDPDRVFDNPYLHTVLGD